MKLGSNKFDIPTVRCMTFGLILAASDQGPCQHWVPSTKGVYCYMSSVLMLPGSDSDAMHLCPAVALLHAAEGVWLDSPPC